jgi:hypothetical protein
MAGCTIKERLIDTIKDEIKGKATSYTFEKERVFIPVSNVTKDKITSKNNAFKTGERIVNKLNLQYKPFTKSDIVSLDTTPKEGVYINIHPDSKVVAAYEYYEYEKDAKEYATVSKNIMDKYIIGEITVEDINKMIEEGEVTKICSVKGKNWRIKQ